MRCQEVSAVRLRVRAVACAHHRTTSLGRLSKGRTSPGCAGRINGGPKMALVPHVVEAALDWLSVWPHTGCSGMVSSIWSAGHADMPRSELASERRSAAACGVKTAARFSRGHVALDAHGFPADRNHRLGMVLGVTRPRVADIIRSRNPTEKVDRHGPPRNRRLGAAGIDAVPG